MKRFILAAGLVAGGLAGLAQAAGKADDAQLRAAIAGSHRSSNNAARDQWRHPYDTLTFFGIKPNMTVVELTPGGGWYTEILAPYLRDSGFSPERDSPQPLPQLPFLTTEDTQRVQKYE